MARLRRLLLLLVVVVLPPALLRAGAAEAEAEGGPFSCLAWSLDGETNRSAGGASLGLHVQCRPEPGQAEARWAEGRPPGLLLLLVVVVVLSVLAQASPPTGNASHFLLVDAKTFPGLAGHRLEVQLRAAGTHDLKASALPSGILDTRVELPLLGLVVGAAGALGLLVGLAALLSHVAYQKGKAAAGLSPRAQLPPSDSAHVKLQGPRLLPRASMSLPSNLQLNDLALEPPQARGAEDEEGALSEPEDSLAAANRGLSLFPMVGYIYRASSGSSEEIWL